ncbi:MAG: hypothetical protein AB1298_00555 [Bacteroidota bacterium]
MSKFLLLPLLVLLYSCSTVPKESVELSVTVGRDITEMQRAHRELVNLYYNRLFAEINRFVDEVYAPFQINKMMDQFGTEICKEIDLQSSDKTKQYEKLSVLVEELRNEIDGYKNSKLKPILAQRDTLLKNIDASYSRIIYANSVVTGHLASVLKINDAQNEILSKLNLGNLRTEIASKTSELSDQIDGLTKKIKAKQGDAEKIIDEFNKLINKVSK